MGDGELAAADPEPVGEVSPPSGWAQSPARVALVALATVVVAAVLWGGYGHRWPWTGINGHTATLWDWLHLLLLPVAFGLLPILLSEKTRMRRGHRWGGGLTVAVLAAFVVAGYDIP